MNRPTTLLRQLLTTELPPPVPVASCSNVTDHIPACSVTKTKKSKCHRVQHCSAVNCKRNRFDNPELSFFRFPKDAERYQRWKVNTRRDDIKKKTAKLYIPVQT